MVQRQGDTIGEAALGGQGVDAGLDDCQQAGGVVNGGGGGCGVVRARFSLWFAVATLAFPAESVKQFFLF